MVVCYGVGWSIQVIFYAPFLGLRAIWLIMQSLVLAFLLYHKTSCLAHVA